MKTKPRKENPKGHRAQENVQVKGGVTKSGLPRDTTVTGPL